MDVIRLLVTISFVLLALLGMRLWWRHRSPATAWLTLMFLVLGLARLSSQLLPDERESALAIAVGAVPAVVVIFPYLLFRFAESFEPVGRRWRAAVLALTIVLVGTALVTVVQALHAQDQPGWYGAYVLGAIGVWTGLTAWVVWRFWSARKREPSVTRWRMRTMALAAGLLNAALVLVGVGDTAALDTAGELLAFASAVTFVAAFAPPQFLRGTWRRADERALWQAEGDVVAAGTRAAVIEAVLPHVARLLGGQGAVFLDRNGAEFAVGLGPDSREPVRTRVASATAEQPLTEVSDGVAVMVLREGRLGVATTPYTPLFGRDELELMERLGILMDLALSRAALYEGEREARAKAEESRLHAEAVSAELEALVYGISHDLRSPIVSVRGYVDCLVEDHAAQLDEEGRHFLSRLQSNTDYMDQLIGDLLKLSQIGKVTDESRTVGLSALAQQIADELQARHPGATIEVDDLPEVKMSTSRARQLLTNLLTNAIVHSGRPDVTIRVGTVASDTVGQACLQVADDGRGIPRPYRERVFGIFETLHRTQDGGSPTTGIGLAISRRVVEEAGGRIWIADSDPGTDVRIQLPEPSEQAGAH